MRYRTSVRPALARAISTGDALLPGELPVSRQLTRRSLWGTMPSMPAARPDDVKRLALTVDLDY